MDITFDAMLPTSFSDVVTHTGINSVTVGGVYYLAADGTGSNKWTPASLPTTS
jgi:hypothetical protein